jgi:hypothetical protein
MVDTEKLDKLQKYSRKIAALSLAVFFVFIGISFWSLWRVRKEVASLEDKKQSLAQSVEDLKLQQKVLSETISKIAIERPEAVKDAINQVTEQPDKPAAQPDKPAADQENNRVKIARIAVDQVIQSAPSVAKSLTRVFLQIGDESQRPRARRVSALLQKEGYVVPGIENVGNRAPQSTQVRCKPRNDAERAEGQKLTSLLQDWGIKVIFQEIGDTTRPWQYEIWFGSDFK